MHAPGPPKGDRALYSSAENNQPRTERDRHMNTFSSPLITPIVNLNGNSKDSLVQPLVEVLHLCRQLQDAMNRASDVCHGRNFQTLPNANAQQSMAREAWAERCMAVEDLRRDIEALAIAINEQ